jgi:predicted MFS family arabinose efflux permease
VSMLAPFRSRSFRYQWPADLATSWAVEMEVLILGWYILVESESVVLLVFFGALQYLGSLVSPLFGVAGDRFGYGRLLWMTRALYAVMAALLGCLAASDTLSPTAVLIIAGLNGLVRPSDMVMRYALIAQYLPASQLMGALGIARITSDSARIAGALAGAGVVAMFGMAPAYLVVTSLYVVSFVLSLQVVPSRSTEADTSDLDRTAASPATPVASASPSASSPWQDLCSAAVYVWQRPALMGGMSMAFLANLVAFPLFIGLLPFVAKNIYGVGQGGLGWLGASFASGALLGSLVLSSNRVRLGAARLMLIAGMGWLMANAWQAQTTTLLSGMAWLAVSGFAQSLCMTPLAAVMLRATEPAYRGRVMGMRILAIWGLPVGLMLSGPLIEQVGFQVTMTGYAVVGMVLTAAIGLRWRQVLWHDAPNR